MKHVPVVMLAISVILIYGGGLCEFRQIRELILTNQECISTLQDARIEELNRAAMDIAVRGKSIAGEQFIEIDFAQSEDPNWVSIKIVETDTDLTNPCREDFAVYESDGYGGEVSWPTEWEEDDYTMCVEQDDGSVIKMHYFDWHELIKAKSKGDTE